MNDIAPEVPAASGKKSYRKASLASLAVVFGVLLIDQCVKFYIKTTMILNSQITVFGDWFYIHFTENPGMAFGLEFGGEYGKLLLTVFRIIAVSGLSYYLYHIIRKKAPIGLVICLSLITAGAAGNIIDSIFYGVIFTDSYFQVAEFMPEQGYATLFHGKVVDMLYFPVMEGYFPDWVPFVGGDHFVFFRPIFNIADSAISIGVFFIILFQKRYFPKEEENDTAQISSATEAPSYGEGSLETGQENKDGNDQVV